MGWKIVEYTLKTIGFLIGMAMALALLWFTIEMCSRIEFMTPYWGWLFAGLLGAGVLTIPVRIVNARRELAELERFVRVLESAMDEWVAFQAGDMSRWDFMRFLQMEAKLP